jgi:hypothetical protein
MKKTMYIVLAAMLSITMSQAQSLDQTVIGATGETISGASNTLSFTLGESIVGNISNGESLGQGFWLGAIEGVVLSNEDFSLSLETSVYPNPVANYLNIHFKDMAGEDFDVMLFDITGKKVLHMGIVRSLENETLDLSPYNTGTYLLNVLQRSTNKTKTFKIIKQ